MPKRAQSRGSHPVSDMPDGGKRHPLNMRTTHAVREKLERAATDSGRSLAQEVEHRLEKSFEREGLLPEVLELAYGRQLAGLLMALGWAMRDAGRMAGFHKHATLEASEQWTDDPYAYDQAMKAVGAILVAARPEGDPTPPERKHPALAALARYGGQMIGGSIAEMLADKRYEATATEGEQAEPIRRLLGPIAARLKRPKGEITITERKEDDS